MRNLRKKAPGFLYFLSEACFEWYPSRFHESKEEGAWLPLLSVRSMFRMIYYTLSRFTDLSNRVTGFLYFLFDACFEWYSSRFTNLKKRATGFLYFLFEACFEWYPSRFMYPCKWIIKAWLMLSWRSCGTLTGLFFEKFRLSLLIWIIVS